MPRLTELLWVSTGEAVPGPATLSNQTGQASQGCQRHWCLGMGIQVVSEPEPARLGSDSHGVV